MSHLIPEMKDPSTMPQAPLLDRLTKGIVAIAEKALEVSDLNERRKLRTTLFEKFQQLNDYAESLKEDYLSFGNAYILYVMQLEIFQSRLTSAKSVHMSMLDKSIETEEKLLARKIPRKEFVAPTIRKYRKY